MVTIEVGIGLPLLWDFGSTISRPQRLRAIIGSLGVGGFPVTVEWDAPESWGDDQFDQVQTRRAYNGFYRQLTNADGTPHTGIHSTPQPFTQFDDDTDHILPVAPNGSTWEWSIPAHAGEPMSVSPPCAVGGVYPRPRGGTYACALRVRPVSGLSPPTRGNRGFLWNETAMKRSIPAHAGEPLAAARAVRSSRVYPRPRGGTTPVPRYRNHGRGLSPPTRGNHRQNDWQPNYGGSIPAHAGEPAASAEKRRRFGVYPRPRGGTTPTRLAS